VKFLTFSVRIGSELGHFSRPFLYASGLEFIRDSPPPALSFRVTSQIPERDITTGCIHATSMRHVLGNKYPRDDLNAGLLHSIYTPPKGVPGIEAVTRGRGGGGLGVLKKI